MSLTVTYGEDSETVVKEAFITVHQQPSVSFGLEGAEIGCVPFAVQLNNMTIDPEEVLSAIHGALVTEQDPQRSILTTLT